MSCRRAKENGLQVKSNQKCKKSFRKCNHFRSNIETVAISSDVVGYSGDGGDDDGESESDDNMDVE